MPGGPRRGQSDLQAGIGQMVAIGKGGQMLPAGSRHSGPSVHAGRKLRNFGPKSLRPPHHCRLTQILRVICTIFEQNLQQR